MTRPANKQLQQTKRRGNSPRTSSFTESRFAAEPNCWADNEVIERMKRLRAFALFLLLFAVSAPSDAAYMFTNLQRLAARADIIAIGSVAEVHQDTFRFQVHEVLRGPVAVEPQELVVIRFRNWPCATRWAPYAEAQRLILFLQEHSSADRSIWQIIGAGGEGEVVVESGTAYVHQAEGQEDHHFDLAEGRFHGESVPLEQFIPAIADYASLFTWPFGWETPQTIKQLASNAEVEAFRGRSPFHDRLVRETQEAVAALANGKRGE